jgi:hypothetical protein
MRRDSSVSIVAGYGRDGRGSIPGKGKIFLFPIESGPTLRPTQPPIQLVPWVNPLGCEADYLTPSTEVKNDGVMPSLPYMSSRHGAKLFQYRDSFTLLFIPLTDIDEFQFAALLTHVSHSLTKICCKTLISYGPI